jgi:electron transfer flavoprotein beta subunit
LNNSLFLAIEEAVRLRERLKASVNSIRAITIGPLKSVEALRTALAIGADSAIHVETPESSPSPEPLAVAKILRAVIEKQNSSATKAEDKVDLIILGKQSIDDDLGVTGQMLAGLLGWSQATFASKLDVDVAKGEAVVVREIDGGGEELRCRLPLVVTTDLR